MALANVERAHDQAVASCQETQARSAHASLASCTIGERITEPSSQLAVKEPSRQLVVKEPEPVQEEPRDEAAEMAKLAAHQQAAMKIVAQHMIQQVDAANAHHERVKSGLSVQLAELGPSDASIDQKVRRRSIESQIKEAERAHAGQLEALEEKVCSASFEHIPECVHRNRHPPHALCTKSPTPSTMPPLCPQASVALSHVEEQHQRALAKLKQETQSEVGSIASTRMSAGNVSLGTDDPVQGSATLQAEALEEWSQLEDKKKDQMRAEAQKLTARMRSKQVEHEQAITAARARADKATSEAARARFEDEIREKEAQHARELQNLEAQASRLPPPPPPPRFHLRLLLTTRHGKRTGNGVSRPYRGRVCEQCRQGKAADVAARLVPGWKFAADVERARARLAVAVAEDAGTTDRGAASGHFMAGRTGALGLQRAARRPSEHPEAPGLQDSDPGQIPCRPCGQLAGRQPCAGHAPSLRDARREPERCRRGLIPRVRGTHAEGES